MVGTRQLHFIEIMEFLLFSAIHVIYSAWMKDVSVTQQVFIYSVGMSILAAGCLIIISNELYKQICFSLCVMLIVHLVGTAMGTLPFGLCIYMVTGTLLSIYGERKLNYNYFIIVNLAIVFDLIMEYDIITAKIPIQFYVIMILTCEIYLITEIYLVLLYQQKVEEIQIKNELLNIAQKSKDEFLANMSHEIRTPMNAIIGMSELIMREENENPKVSQYCHNIQSSGNDLLAIINDILDFSKIESGKMSITDEPYSIAASIFEVVNTAMFRRGYKDVAMVVDVSPNMPKLLNGDEIRIRQILTNIVTNAVKFTEQGYIFVQAKCYEKYGENYLSITVKDSGMGIRKEDLAQLFESFKRLDSKKNRSIEGTGLGLPICKRLVELMHGTIRISSEYGKGTTVIIEIPQKIIDSSPSLTLKKKDISVVTFTMPNKNDTSERSEYYNIVSKHMWEALSVNNITCNSVNEFKDAVNGKYATHVIVSVEAYRKNREFICGLAKEKKVFVLCDPRYAFNLGEGIFAINMPYCSVSVVSAINGETYINELSNDEKLVGSFIAPDATVLVVDDNDLNRKVAEGILKVYKVHCILAESGKEAINILQSRAVDIVLMDHMMPELDGVETTNMIRQSGTEDYRNVPIVAMTANAVNDSKQMFLKNGFQDFLPKPVKVKDVGSVLKKWLPDEMIVYSSDDETAAPDGSSAKDSEKVSDQSTENNDRDYVEVDENMALENMGGQRDLYKELLEYCIELEEKRWKDIQDTFDAQNWDEYTILVHALKGGMRSLGIEELALAAQRQEFACKEGRINDAIAGHGTLKELYDWTHRSIEHFLETFEV